MESSLEQQLLTDVARRDVFNNRMITDFFKSFAKTVSIESFTKSSGK